MMGLIANAEARRALAPPILPFFFKFSRVSSAPPHAGTPHQVGHRTNEVIQSHSAPCKAGRRHHVDSFAHGRRSAVDDANRNIERGDLSTLLSGLFGGREFGRQRDNQDCAGTFFGQCGECFGKLARGRGSSLWQYRAC